MVDPLIIKSILKGLLTFIPGVSSLITKNKTNSNHSCSNAEFCYTLWLRILVLFKENGIKPNFRTLGEIGNGGSFGVGICALLSGCEKYYALEIEEIFDKDQNLKILDELILLFRNKTRISDKYSQLNIKINNLEYPEDMIEPLFLGNTIIKDIRNDIITGFKNSKRISVIKNWVTHPSLNLDFIFSRAVMEHVSSPGNVYSGITFHLKEGSFMFHDIEFHSHGLTKKNDGHILIPDYLWRIIFGRRMYFLNRWQAKDHYSTIINNGFEVIKTQENYLNHSDSSEKALYGATILAKKRNEQYCHH